MSWLPGRQGGFSIISAIFILVVLAVLAAVMVTLASIQHQASAIVIETSRAEAAARSGMEWGAYQALEQNSCAASTDFELDEGALAGFSVEVSCNSSGHNERGRTITIYQISVTAERGQQGRPDHVKRELSAQFARDS